MSAILTPLSTILNRMDRYQAASIVENQYKVRDIDTAIRRIRRKMALPWTLKQTTLRVFEDVLIYPTETDHDELAFFDNDTYLYSKKPDMRATSIREFLTNPRFNQNDLAEIWDQGSRMIGIRYKTKNATNVLLNNAETASDWTASADASSPALDSVFYKEGNGSIRFTVTLSASSAIIAASNSSLSDTLYKKKYYFQWVYLPSAPTSINLRFGSSSANYFTANVTTQFSGQAFKAGAWNLVAMDLNEASETGTVVTTAFDYQALELIGAASGTYYVDAAYLREWELLDNWYYSKFLIATVGETVADQEYFYNSSEVYATDSQLVGDSEFVDMIFFLALKETMGDEENEVIMKMIKANGDEALADFMDEYPDEVPLVTTSRYDFEDMHPAQAWGEPGFGPGRASN